MPPLLSRSPLSEPGAPGVAEPVGLLVVPLVPGRLVHIASAVLVIFVPGATVVSRVASKAMSIWQPGVIVSTKMSRVSPTVLSTMPGAVQPAGVMVRPLSPARPDGSVSVIATSWAGLRLAPAAAVTVMVNEIVSPASPVAGIADLATVTAGSAMRTCTLFELPLSALPLPRVVKLLLRLSPTSLLPAPALLTSALNSSSKNSSSVSLSALVTSPKAKTGSVPLENGPPEMAPGGRGNVIEALGTAPGPDALPLIVGIASVLEDNPAPLLTNAAVAVPSSRKVSPDGRLSRTLSCVISPSGMRTAAR